MDRLLAKQQFTQHKSHVAGVTCPIDKSGAPPEDSGMETRIAKLETGTEFISRDLKDLREDVRTLRTDIAGIRTTDFRLLFGAIIAVALGLTGVIAKGFHWF